MKNTGLTEQEWDQIRNVLHTVPAIEKAVLFGSRAMGLARGNSDVDIMLYGDGLALGDVAHARALLEETTLPYQFDMVLYNDENDNLRKHVEQYGRVLISKSNINISNWTIMPLESAGVMLIDCDHRTPKEQDFGFPYITIPQLKDGHIAYREARKISKEDFIEWTKKLMPQKDDVVVVRRCNSGESAVIPDGLQCAIGQNLVVLRADGQHVYPPFLRWLVRGQEWWAEVRKFINVGAVFDSLRCRDIPKFRLPIPPKAYQKQIVSILDNLDARIQLLRETNVTLEAIAQALFKSWFVDFDPVHAKAEGRIPEGMDAETVALFPSEFEESELGMIPRGWRVAPIGGYVTIVGGGTPSTKKPGYWTPEEYAWTSPKDLSGLSSPVLLSTEKKISAVGLGVISSGLLPAGTFLLSSRAPIGYLAITEIPLAINQGYIAVTPESELPPLFMYFWCKLNMETIKGHANGSTFMEISKKSFRLIPAIIPERSVVDACLPELHCLFERIATNEKQAHTLTSLRDTLLPRLISGKLRLPEFVEPVSEAPE